MPLVNILNKVVFPTLGKPYNACFHILQTASLKERKYNNSIHMKYRLLGKTGLSVSEIGFGSWAIGGSMDVSGFPVGWRDVTDTESIAAIERAVGSWNQLF